MNAAEKETKEVLRGLGFDEFMVGQIFMDLNNRGLICKEPLGDSYSKVSQALDDQGWDLSEIQAAIEAMLDAGVVFRLR